MSPIDDISNWEIFLWALFRLEGSTKFVDIEDIALECHKIAPSRFSWRTKPGLPDYKKCTKALQEAEIRSPKLLLKTQDTFGRQLSEEGQRWIEKNHGRLSYIFRSGKSIPEPKNRPSRKLLTEIERNNIFVLWKEKNELPNEKWQMADILFCSPDSNKKIWLDHLESLKAVAYSSKNIDVLNFLNEICKIHPDWFGGEN